MGAAMMLSLLLGAIGAFLGCGLFFLIFFREIKRPDDLEKSDRLKLDDIIIHIGAIHYQLKKIMETMNHE